MHAIRFVAVIVLMVLAIPCLAAEKRGDEAEKEKKAVEAAGAWLALVDQGKYGESWDAAAKYFRDAISKEDWNKAIKSARNPLGAVKSRELKSKEYRTSLPGAPDGEYMVIQYQTSFENKKSAVETITPMLDKDKKWRVSGYFIK